MLHSSGSSSKGVLIAKQLVDLRRIQMWAFLLWNSVTQPTPAPMPTAAAPMPTSSELVPLAPWVWWECG
jgi:hypothetical protein